MCLGGYPSYHWHPLIVFLCIPLHPYLFIFSIFLFSFFCFCFIFCFVLFFSFLLFQVLVSYFEGCRSITTHKSFVFTQRSYQRIFCFYIIPFSVWFTMPNGSRIGNIEVIRHTEVWRTKRIFIHLSWTLKLLEKRDLIYLLDLTPCKLPHLKTKLIERRQIRRL